MNNLIFTNSGYVVDWDNIDIIEPLADENQITQNGESVIKGFLIKTKSGNQCYLSMELYRELLEEHKKIMEKIYNRGGK